MITKSRIVWPLVIIALAAGARAAWVGAIDKGLYSFVVVPAVIALVGFLLEVRGQSDQ